ncbi:MAG TPA: hypothetical protein ENH11_04170 [Candidatus Acetothermia bacterium]|nr:hypothetical protein [Candidatus Acetothermia bacterium]
MERVFAELTQKRIQRGLFRNIPEFIDALDQYLSIYNEHPTPFVWMVKGENILRKVSQRKTIAKAKGTSHSTQASFNK